MELDSYFDIGKLNKQLNRVNWVKELLIYHIDLGNWDKVILIAKTLKKAQEKR